jgi:glycosyltransferase involved in cell wall biosynthesis
MWKSFVANAESKQRLLIFIVAYNAEKTIADVLRRMPDALADSYDVEVLVIDDASQDKTFERGHAHSRESGGPFPIKVLFNPVNQGYGGNQKIGFHYAIKNGFDFVALVHGDGQYAPECLPDLLAPLSSGDADAVFGSRMISPGAARSGGMPLYKYVGNKILTWSQNTLLNSALSEFHSGYRIYSVAALARIRFHLNTNVFHFDTEIIIQLLFAGQRIKELPIPTYYGDEICHVDGLRYAWDVATTTLKAKAQSFGLFYDRKFDCASDAAGNAKYATKLDYRSPQSVALEKVGCGDRVVDFGCGEGTFDAALRAKGCYVTGVDFKEPADADGFDNFVVHNLDSAELPIDLFDQEYLLFLDIIEHLKSPEAFVESLRQGLIRNPSAKLLVSTGNVGFILTRLGLIFGMFNYGPRGILDLTHTRLFTFATIRRLFEQGGFTVVDVQGIPAPFPLAFGSGSLSKSLLSLNAIAIRVWRSLFAYQVFMIVEPRPALEYLLETAETVSAERAQDDGAD